MHSYHDNVVSTNVHNYGGRGGDDTEGIDNLWSMCSWYVG